MIHLRKSVTVGRTLRRSGMPALLALVALVLVLTNGCSAPSTDHAPTTTSAPESTEPAPTLTPSGPDVEATEAGSPETPAWAETSSFDEFLDLAYAAQLKRDPELLSELGLADAFGMDNSRLTDVSNAYQLETYALYQNQLDTLRSFDRAALSPDQQLSYDAFEWYLDDQLRGEEFRFYEYPVKQVLGIHNTLIELMTDRHPVANLKNAQDYIARLKQFPTKIDALIAWLKLQEAEGITPPKFAIQNVLWQLRGFLSQPPEGTALYTAFEAKVAALSGVSAEEKATLVADAREAIEESVQPAYQELVDYFSHLQSIAGTDGSFSLLPNGEAAYAYALRHHTTTDLTADEIHELGLQEIERIHAEMDTLFDELGITGGSLSEKMNRVAVLSGFTQGQAALDAYQALIDGANRRLSGLFNIRPRAEVIVVAMEAPNAVGAYYVSGALDGSRPGMFYVGLGGSRPRYDMPTLAYHEAVPGHHLQIAVQQELTGVPNFRKGANYTAYAEGWALYAERLAWEAGWYDDDPYGNLGRLQSEAFRAARLVIDTGIHARDWSREQGIAYMVENVGYPKEQAAYEVERYIVWPGQATAYKVGMLKILELRQRAMDALGDNFDLKEFHDVILKDGALPLEILERVVDDYIKAKLGR